MRTITPLALAVLASALMFSSTADAVALGNIAAQSSLGQPLRVVIPVALVGGETLNTTCVRLVSDGAPDGPPQVVAGRIHLDSGGSNPRLLVTTARLISEPALRFSVQAGCDGTIRRDYVLLFDPPEMQRPAMLASSDSGEFAQYTRSSRTAAGASSGRARPTAIASATPVSIKSSRSDVATARTNSARISPNVNSTVNAPPAATPTEDPATAPDTLVADSGNSGGLIAQASAQAMPRVTTSLPRSATPASPLESSASAWKGSSLYAVAGFAIIILGLTAFSLRRHMNRAATFAASVSHGGPMDLNTQAAGTDTFAHFGAMAETAPSTPTLRAAQVPAMVPTLEDDTLLGAITGDVIDEQTVRDAWKMAVAETAAEDLGTDSILKAIAAAEKDMRIGQPEPFQSAMDRALEEDLFRDIPNPRKS
ncbi:MAG: hypothetical protein E6H74_00985 [Betaproteobacteria bacterium]|nr:MAG: hypothetical protein E6H74_00985 [Betaproteobacteria bacterium]